MVLLGVQDSRVGGSHLSPPTFGLKPKEEPGKRAHHQLHSLHHPLSHSPLPLQPQALHQPHRYMIPNTSGILPAPAHIGFIPTSQSHVPTHPLPAHLPAFLQQGTASFAVSPAHTAYLTQAGMLGGIPSAAGLASSRSNRQPAFPAYLFSSYD